MGSMNFYYERRTFLLFLLSLSFWDLSGTFLSLVIRNCELIKATKQRHWRVHWFGPMKVTMHYLQWRVQVQITLNQRNRIIVDTWWTLSVALKKLRSIITLSSVRDCPSCNKGNNRCLLLVFILGSNGTISNIAFHPSFALQTSLRWVLIVGIILPKQAENIKNLPVLIN